MVYNIQRFSTHDGQGIRTMIFYKGCPLRCEWCSNPESQSFEPDVMFDKRICKGFGDCALAYPEAITLNSHGVCIDRTVMQDPGKLRRICASKALTVVGECKTTGELLAEIEKDIPFYRRSQGGVTLSGGEPSLSNDFAFAILEQCKRHQLHTAIETCGEGPWELLERLLPVTDLIMMDIKHIATDKHQYATGRSNERILENARRLALTDKSMIFRTPVVPTVNDSHDDIGQIASFVRTLIDSRVRNGAAGKGKAGITYELLTFHKLASDKYRSLGLVYEAAAIDPPSREQMQGLVDLAAGCGVETTFR